MLLIRTGTRNYLTEVGDIRDPCLSIFPTRIETRGMHKHLARIPTSDGSKCCSIKITGKLTVESTLGKFR